MAIWKCQQHIEIEIMLGGYVTLGIIFLLYRKDRFVNHA